MMERIGKNDKVKSRWSFDKHVFNMLDILRSPLITFDATWADCIPQRLANIITIGRMKMMMEKKELASDPEVVAYLMTRSFDAPMSSDWIEIYLHISCKVAQEYWDEDHWNDVQARRTLTEYQDRYHLLPLRVFIYNSRRKALHNKMKAEQKMQVGTCPLTEEKYEELSTT